MRVRVRRPILSMWATAECHGVTRTVADEYGSDCSSARSTVFGGNNTSDVSASNWGPCVPSMCSPPLVYPTSYGGLPHLPQAPGKATRPVMQRLGNRRNVLPEATPTNHVRNGLPKDRGDISSPLIQGYIDRKWSRISLGTDKSSR